MAVYIQSAQCISPQQTFLKDGISEQPLVFTELTICEKINVKNYLPPLQARRISRMIKICHACAIETMNTSEVDKPDAIITASGLGCIEPTEKFLNDMLKTNEGLLAPTSFIQSTSNAVGGQLALHYKCNGYNVLYAQKSLSFESALLDAYLRISDNAEANILVGGFDEVTKENSALKQNMGIFKTKYSSDHIPGLKNDGAIPGESASFFLLGNTLSENSIAQLKLATTSYRLKSIEECRDWIQASLQLAGLNFHDIDVLLTGFNGDKNTDRFYSDIAETCFEQSTIARFKHLCGEHDTASAFGTWLGVSGIKNKSIPVHCIVTDRKRPVKNVLIYNQQHARQHSLILLQDI